MIVMPSNATGWRWHCLARETGKLGHLYSPGGERGPWPHFPYALDNGAFPCWDGTRFDDARWTETQPRVMELWAWAQQQTQRPLWAVVPDVPGDRDRTLRRWDEWASLCPHPRAIAVQDGMTPADVRALRPAPDVIFIGGGTDWKWRTVWNWAAEFPRVHIGRMNAPDMLGQLETAGVESCDGTGWMRGDKRQQLGLERWLRSRGAPIRSLVFADERQVELCL